MKTYQKAAQHDEQELLAKLLPVRILRAKQRTFWTINTKNITLQFVAIGRIPKDIKVTEEWLNQTELDTVMLEENDLFECYDKSTDVGKYSIETKCFTGGTDKFKQISIQWDQILNLSKLNCVELENLGVTSQVIKKKKTYLSNEQTTKSIAAKFYYKFHFL